MTPSARVTLVSATESIVTLMAGVMTFAMGDEELGWLLILLSLIGGTVGAGFIYLGRQSMARATALSSRPTEGRLDTATAGTMPIKKDTADIMPMRWAGKASVPSGLGYVLVGPPLAVLELREGRLLLGVRPRIVELLFRMVFGTERLAITPDDNVVILSFQRGLGPAGIELRIPHSPSYYFWTRRRDEVIAAAAALGFEVATEETS